MSVLPIAPLSGLGAAQSLLPSGMAAAPVGGDSFVKMLSDGIGAVNQKLVQADNVVRAFAADDSIPVHQVTFALEEARLSLELMMQVRTRLVESYQRIMEMQL
ncbi:MAG TPA: flagellar hook-basal body complex protein FliE [Allosphingosinicella sp.]|jgi:flagellar hook-basal body complex protein FliE